MNATSNNPLTDKARLHIWVHGRVQGVGFRAFTQRVALDLGLTGWVRNVGYDQVEIVAEGSLPVLERFVEIVRAGPPASRVDDCRIEREAELGEFARFEVRASR